MSQRALPLDRAFSMRRAGDVAEASRVVGDRLLRLSAVGVGGPTIYLLTYGVDRTTLCVYPIGPRRTVWLSQSKTPFEWPPETEGIARGVSEVNGSLVSWFETPTKSGGSQRGSVAWGTIGSRHFRLQSAALSAAELVELSALIG